jgi:hypothetical protein
MARNCPGKLGDGLIMGAFASYLYDQGLEVCLLTNPIVYPYLISTYNYEIRKVEDDADLWEAFRPYFDWSDAVVIPKPLGDPDASAIKRHLQKQHHPASPSLLHIGGLDAFSTSRHILWQLFDKAVPFLDMPMPQKVYPMVFFPLEEDAPLDAQSSCLHTLVLPVAGGRLKQLTPGQICGLRNAMASPAEIVATEYGSDPNHLKTLEDDLQGLISAGFYVSSVPRLFVKAMCARRIIGADSGLMWLLVSFLNGRAWQGKLGRSNFPQIMVFHQGALRRVPSFQSWHPLLVYPEKLIKIDAKDFSLQCFQDGREEEYGD